MENRAAEHVTEGLLSVRGYDRKTTTALYMAGSNISRLSDDTTDLENLEELNVPENLLTSLPAIVGDLVSLRCLSVEENRLYSLPDSIGNLRNLEVLHASSNFLVSLPASIGNLKSLRVLDLNMNYIVSLPASIADLDALVKLNLSRNRLSSLPALANKLPNLQELYLGYNRLATIPDITGAFQGLVKLFVNNNSLTHLPIGVSGLKRLQMLHAGINRILDVDGVFTGPGDLEEVYLNNNLLKTLPAEISGLMRLKKLYLNCNRLRELSFEMQGMHALRLLNASHNSLTFLSDQVGALKDLEELSLEQNQLREIPSTVGNMTGLRNLNLSHNPLSTLPDSLLGLPDSLALLNLQETRFTQVDQARLRAVFGDHVVFTVTSAAKETKAVPEKDVYDSLRSRPLCWNFDKVRAIRAKPIPVSKLSEEQLRSLFATIATHVSLDNQRLVENFIHHLYCPGDAYTRWRMDEKHVPMAKNVLGAVVQILSGVKDDNQKIVSNINAIAEGLTYCPDRQMSEMMFAYYLLTGEIDPSSSLEDFVRFFFAQEKMRIFEAAINTGSSGQNVHIHTHWMYELRDKVGFDFEFRTQIGTMGHDRFNGWHGNALRAFYAVFTPEYFIGELVKSINSRPDMLNESLRLVSSDQGVDINRANLMYTIDRSRICYDNTMALLTLCQDKKFVNAVQMEAYKAETVGELLDRVLAELRVESEGASDDALRKRALAIISLSKSRPVPAIAGRVLFEDALEFFKRNAFFVSDMDQRVFYGSAVTPEFATHLLAKMGIIVRRRT